MSVGSCVAQFFWPYLRALFLLVLCVLLFFLWFLDLFCFSFDYSSVSRLVERWLCEAQHEALAAEGCLAARSDLACPSSFAESGADTSLDVAFAQTLRRNVLDGGLPFQVRKFNTFVFAAFQRQPCFRGHTFLDQASGLPCRSFLSSGLDHAAFVRQSFAQFCDQKSLKGSLDLASLEQACLGSGPFLLDYSAPTRRSPLRFRVLNVFPDGRFAWQ